MIIVEVLVERIANALNRSFSYAYDLDDEIKIGERVIVNFNNKDIVAYVVNVFKDDLSYEEKCKELGFELNKVIQVLDRSPILNDELMSLADTLSSYYMCPKIAILQAMLPPSLKPKSSALRSPKIKYEKYLKIKQYNEDGLTDKQIEILRLIKDNDEVLKSDIKSVSIINKLIEKDLIEVVLKEKNRLNLKQNVIYSKKNLTPLQEHVVNEFINTDKDISLLEGVTGSGKSEVYLHLAEHYLKQNKNILMLVPEISLTPMMIDMFLSRFANKVAVLHSDLTPSEKYDEYRRILKDDVRVVVGARSAIFAPIKNIGLIILDEEHAETYKQDSTPFYHAKEVAILRAKYHNAKVLLGSATPTIETRTKALKGVYKHLIMDKRINDFDLPKTYIVDMLKPININKKSSMFSNLLIDKINDRLSKNEQIVLLINRRGYSSYLNCRECGHYFKCPECGVALTYHRHDNMLKCHHCDYVSKMPDYCPSCGSKKIFRNGFGTERIEEEVAKLFPNAKTLRLDSDVGKIKNNVSKILNQFRNKEADILIGTQMIAKGHDFENVTLVGIVLADIGLAIPSFRSSERAFQLITQAVGRSGRGSKQGEAIIQTYLPSNFAINFAAKQDYNTFFKRELYNRSLSKYPPYSHLLSIKIKTKNETLSKEISTKICTDLRKLNLDDVTVLGPTEPYINFEKGYYTKLIIIKYSKGELIRKEILKIQKNLMRRSDVKISIDIDPYDF